VNRDVPRLYTEARSFMNTGSTATAQAIILSNPGHAALTIGGISVTGANPGQFAQTNNCGITLTSGTYCTISITFTPVAVASYTATLAVETMLPTRHKVSSLRE
jgi:hypothetical protein